MFKKLARLTAATCILGLALTAAGCSGRHSHHSGCGCGHHGYSSYGHGHHGHSYHY